MDWEALRLSLLLAIATGLVLIPAGVMVARGLAYADFRGKSIDFAIRRQHIVRALHLRPLLLLIPVRWGLVHFAFLLLFWMWIGLAYLRRVICDANGLACG